MNNHPKKNVRKVQIIAGIILLFLTFTGCESVISDNIADVYNDLKGQEEETVIITAEDLPTEPLEPKTETKPLEAEAEETPDVETEEAVVEEEKITVDLIFFMGQSNMAGCGGNAMYAPKVVDGAGYEFRSISDPTKLYPITEPFGLNENNLNAILDLPGAKKGSLVSAFTNRYFELTQTPLVAVSASAGDTDTAFWMSDAVVADYMERMRRAVVWLESSGYTIRHKYVIWLQGESDAIDNLSSEQYVTNMDTIIRPMFIEGVEKLFFITPGRTITRSNYFEKIIAAQIKMSRESGYYALGTTILSGISTEYMVDEWHYNQKVLNLVGEECANSVAYYTLNGKECSLYDYRNKNTYHPDSDESDDSEVAPIDFASYNFDLD